MRFLSLCLVLLSGCVLSSPADPTITADLACEGARLAITYRLKPPSPSPAPAPSGQCENCNGTGKIGDGRIVMTCPECRGTGKIAKSVLVRPDCTDGKCKP